MGRLVHRGRGRPAAAPARGQLLALRQRDELRLHVRHRDRPVVPDPARARRQWFSSGRVCFSTLPIADRGSAASWALRRAPMEMGLLGSLVLVNTLFFARVQFWSGDWAWGPRYMQIVLPCLAAMAAPADDLGLWRRAVLLTALGLVFAALPAVLIRFTYLFNTAYLAMPPDRLSGGPSDWDNSYYASCGTRGGSTDGLASAPIPKTVANTVSGSGQSRVEFWWPRPSATAGCGACASGCSRRSPLSRASGCSAATRRALRSPPRHPNPRRRGFRHR